MRSNQTEVERDADRIKNATRYRNVVVTKQRKRRNFVEGK